MTLPVLAIWAFIYSSNLISGSSKGFVCTDVLKMKSLFSLAFIFSGLLSVVLATIPTFDQAVDRAAFPEGLAGLNLVEFYSPDCHHCRAYRRVLQKVRQYVDANQETLHDLKIQQFNCKGGSYCQKLGLEALPSLRIYLHDTNLAVLDGAATTHEVIDWIVLTIRRNENVIQEAFMMTKRNENQDDDLSDESKSDSEREDSEFKDESSISTQSPVTSTPSPTRRNLQTPTPNPTTTSLASPTTTPTPVPTNRLIPKQ